MPLCYSVCINRVYLCCHHVCRFSVCVGMTLKGGGGFLSYMYSCFDLRTNIPVHGVTMEILIEKKGGGEAFLGQSIGDPFKPEHSAGRFSKCQSHFWMWTDSLMDHSDKSVGGGRKGGGGRKQRQNGSTAALCILL